MTIQRAIKKGLISAERDENDAYKIDPAELHRVFPPAPNTQGDGVSGDTSKRRPDTALLTRELELLEDRINGLQEDRRQERELFERTIDDLRTRLDQESEERRGLTRMLMDARAAPTSAPEPEEAVAPAPRKKKILGVFG